MTSLLGEANSMHSHIKQIDKEMQTLVYENYKKFISAADLTKEIDESFSSPEITEDLQDLRSALNRINESQKVIDDRLRPKLK